MNHCIYLRGYLKLLKSVPYYIEKYSNYSSVKNSVFTISGFKEHLCIYLMVFSDVEKLSKMKKLLEILSNPSKRMPLETLLKCEAVLEKLKRVSINIKGKPGKVK